MFNCGLLTLARNVSSLERNELRLARKETRSGNLNFSLVQSKSVYAQMLVLHTLHLSDNV